MYWRNAKAQPTLRAALQKSRVTLSAQLCMRENRRKGVVLSKNAAFRCGLGLVERPNKQSRQRVDTKHLEI